ncbi:hypothetical protein BDW62DRAFT_201890 [Aspergillus aurantiobrunneus]
MPCHTYTDMCFQCRSHYSLLSQEASEETQGAHPAALYERSRDSYPVVFTAQYRNGGARERGFELAHEVGLRLFKLLGQWVPFYLDIRTFEFKTPEECPIIWISILVDFPVRVQVDQELEDYVFGDSAVLLWNDSIPVDLEDDDEYLCLFRLEWFMKRLTGLPFCSKPSLRLSG